MISNLTGSKPHRLMQTASAGREDVRLAARRGTRGLLAAIGLGLLVWLLTGIAVSLAVLG